MDIVNSAGLVLFTAAVDTIKQLLIKAVSERAHLYGADLYGADLRGADLRGADLCGADLRGADLYGAHLYGAHLRGADGEKKKVHSLRSFSSSLYPYIVLAVLFEDGEKMVKMGCLGKTLSEWKKVGIRKSNESEFPDNGSEACEDRVGLFNLAKAAVTRMKLEAKK